MNAPDEEQVPQKRAPASEKPILESLSLCESKRESPTQSAVESQCLLCDHRYDVSTAQRDELLKHLATIHKLVIGDVNLIADLKKYLCYWKQRFNEEDFRNFCSMICTNTKETDRDPPEEYYLLCDALIEDKQLREFLQKKKLEKVLSVQQGEREDDKFNRTCLFCRTQFSGKRSDMFNHMTHEHSFSIGLPDNLVYTDELLDELQAKLDNLQCLYCEKTFKDKTVLKEHMRKKQHKRINPKNRSYDKYYIINYLEMGRNWEAIQSEPECEEEDQTDTDGEEGWEEWEEVGTQAVCLFCEFSSSLGDRLGAHMQELHDFDLQEIKLRLNLNFYQQVKLVNFIRRQIYLGQCINCGEKFPDKKELIEHMHSMKHMDNFPDKTVWDQPQYFFPTYENDNLLCQLYDDDGHTSDDLVIAEDPPTVDKRILTEDLIRRDILLDAT